MLRLGISPGQGRGVFAARDIRSGETLEDAPVIVVPKEDVPALKRTLLFHYYFLWGGHSGEAAICLGFGSIYNHSERPNVEYVRLFERHLIRFRALRDIKEGEELCTNYHGDRAADTPFPFEDGNVRTPSSCRSGAP